MINWAIVFQVFIVMPIVVSFIGWFIVHELKEWWQNGGKK